MNTEQVNIFKLNHKAYLKARENLKPIIKQTNLIYSDYFSSNMVLTYILNLAFRTGSFKLRGAFGHCNPF